MIGLCKIFVKLFRLMSRQAYIREFSGRLRGLLPGSGWIYVLSLLLPLALYDIFLKVLRVSGQLDLPGFLGFLDQIRSEVLFHTGFIMFWVGVFALARRGFPRWVALVLLHAAALFIALLTTAAHFFYGATGSTLDYNFLVVSLSAWEQTRQVVVGESTALSWALLAAGVFYLIAGPLLVTRAFVRWRPVRSRRVRVPGRSWLVPAAVGALGVAVVGGLSLLPSATGVGSDFSRQAVVGIAASEFTEPPATEDGVEIQPQLVAQDLPTDASLVQTPRTEQRNVVMVFMESTRARSTTVYNEDLKNTPFMEELARESLVAERAYAVLPHTSKALTAGNCGIEPPLDMDNTEADPDAIPAQCLADLLKEQGYNTAFFQSATEKFERRRALVENFGYEDFQPLESMDREGFEKVNYFGYEDDIMLEPSRRWLEEKGRDKPFLATYLTVTGHHDYSVPEEFAKEDYVEDEQLNDYLNAVRYQDTFLRNLFDQYKELGLYEDTVFVIVGDHGEGFAEHGLYQHDNTIYNEGLKIPFLIHDPRRAEWASNGARVEAPVNQMDVLPTLADLLGYDIAGGRYHGASLLAPPQDRTIMASCYRQDNCLTAIDGDDKYIYHYGSKPEEYFKLSEDSREQDNVADEYPRKTEVYREDLLRWKKRVDAMYDRRATEETAEETTAE